MSSRSGAPHRRRLSVPVKSIQELLPGAWALALPRFEDERGSFLKLLAASRLTELGLPFVLREQFLTTSRRDVIRGMHFQRPPHHHVKLVCCLAGRVQDVLLDLRAGAGYGRVAAFELDADHPVLLYVPAGIAHGFRARTDGAAMMYLTSSEHAPSHDTGVLWSSIDHDWDCARPVVSQRDLQHPALSDWVSPFDEGACP